MEKLEFTEDDEMDQNVFAAKYHSQANETKDTIEEVGKETFNLSEEKKMISKTIANEMLKLRQEEEEDIFRVLLKENLRRKMQKKKESHDSDSKNK